MVVHKTRNRTLEIDQINLKIFGGKTKTKEEGVQVQGLASVLLVLDEVWDPTHLRVRRESVNWKWPTHGEPTKNRAGMAL